ncbi:G-patch domain and KOW motifs-containing protein-like [Rhopilema esculentum]|uniref:G-patch domain and KOW motifs-containing protein-like n=1 Tax=Rhopilema esculentum TaxID=499914 RepID=UPI0031DC7D9B
MASTNQAVSKDEKSFSFKIGKSKKTSALSLENHNSTFKEKKEDQDDVDYVVSAEGKQFKSVKPKEEKKKLIIPLSGSDFIGKSEDQEAAKEILRDLDDDIKAESNSKSAAIPLLMRSKLPVKLGDNDGEKLDVSLMPSESTRDDYEDIPVTAFGAAMLRGMGWREGEAIGLTNKGLSEPIEFIPRHKGLGLGAEKRQEEMKAKRRKLGESTDPKRNGPIVEKDGKVRHYKGVGETVYQHPQGFAKGAYCLVEKGPHKGLYGVIVAIDEDNARVTAKLALGAQQITMSQYNMTVVSEDEYRSNSTGKRKHPTGDNSPSFKKPRDTIESIKTKYEKEGRNDTKTHCWLAPKIRVRIISKSFKKGFYYNKKVEIVDVVSRKMCTCRTDEGRLLEGIEQSDLETVIPKKSNALVFVVEGKYKGQIGKLLERDHEKCRAHVQLLSNKHITKLVYDAMSEYLGTPGDDDFL